MFLFLLIPLALVSSGLISVGVPGLVTVMIWLRPDWQPLRRSALAGVAGATLGIATDLVLVILPFLLLRLGQGALSVTDRPLEPLAGFIGLAALSGIFTGMPALSVLGYLTGFLRHWRKQHPPSLTAA